MYLPGDVEIVPWRTFHRWVNGGTETERDIYMSENRLNKGTPLESVNGDVDKTMILWSKGLWTPPTFKFVEATTRKELGRLKKALGPK